MGQRRLPAFVINLAERTERLTRFQSRVQQASAYLAQHINDFEVKVERWPAVDTRTLAQLESFRHQVDPKAWQTLLNSTIPTGRRQFHADLTPGAVGCALSHVEVAQHARQRQLPTIAVFEDDAHVLPHTFHDIYRLLAKMECHNITWDCLLMGWSGAPPESACVIDSQQSVDNDETIHHFQLQRVHRFWGLHAYILSASGIHKMAQLWNDQRKIDTHVDHALSRDDDFVVYGLSHNRIPQDCKGSDIHLPVLPGQR